MIDNGYEYKEMADELKISMKSISFHVCALYDKIGVRSQVLAVRWGIEHGYLPEIRRHPILQNVRKQNN